MSSCFKNASFFKEIPRILHQNGLHSDLGCANRGTPFFEQSRSNKALKNKPTIKLILIRIDAELNYGVAIPWYDSRLDI